MPSPEKILAAVRELEPQLPLLLGASAASVQSELVPLKADLAAGRTNGEDLLQLLRGYPVVAELLQQQLEQSEESVASETPDEAYEYYGVNRSVYQRLAGDPATAVPGKKYICPIPECSSAPWFQIGLRIPPLCEKHGVGMVLAADEG